MITYKWIETRYKSNSHLLATEVGRMDSWFYVAYNMELWTNHLNLADVTKTHETTKGFVNLSFNVGKPLWTVASISCT